MFIQDYNSTVYMYSSNSNFSDNVKTTGARNYRYYADGYRLDFYNSF